MNIIIFLVNFLFIVMPQFVLTHADTINSSFIIIHTSIKALRRDLLYYFDADKNILTFSISELDDHIHENITNTTNRNIIIEYCKSIYFQMITEATFEGFLGFLQNLFQGSGPLEATYLFTGYYPPFNISIFGSVYSVALAFLFVSMAVLIICIFMMVFYSSVSIQEAFITRNKKSYYYSNEVFSAWDYSIKEENSAEQQHYRIVLQLKTSLDEDRMARLVTRWSTEMWLKLYTVRFIINIFIILWLVLCCYVIYLVASYQLLELHKDHLLKFGLQTLFIQYLPSLTIVFLNGMSTTIFDILVSFEKYPMETSVNLSLFRNVFLYLSSLVILLNTVYGDITCKPKDICGVGQHINCPSPRCWETYVGQQMFKLTIIDMLVYFSVLIFYDVVQYCITHAFDNALTRFWDHPVFYLPTEVLAPINSQTILWLGVFHSPLLPAVMICKIVIIFYIKKFKILVLCDPTERSYRTSRFNSAFMTLLIISFFFVMILQNFMIESIPPSRGCGPFRYYNSLIEAVPDVVRYYMSGLFSVWCIIFASLVLCFFIHYYWRLLHTHKNLLRSLKDHLILESFDKQYLIKQIADLTDYTPKRSSQNRR